LKRIRSGVEAPEENDGVFGVGGARVPKEAGEMGFETESVLGPPMVVLRVAFVVSDEGGGGRWARLVGERMCARQRKHSPVPK
jgi:hypothetical protein